MVYVLTGVMMLILAYCHFRDGLFTAVCALVNVFLAGLITFNFWEPLAGLMDGLLDRSFLHGYEDFMVLIVLYALSLLLLRAATHGVNKAQVEFPPALNQLGAAAVALVTGYLLSGFLICALETLPWHQHFMGFEPYSEAEPGYRRFMPADRLWLALMYRAGTAGLSRGEGMPTFDAEGTFETNYLRFRRYAEPPSEPAKQ